MISLNPDIKIKLNSANKRLIERICKRPPAADVSYEEVKRLLEAFGAQVLEKGGGSHFHAVLHGVRFQVTRPHSKCGRPCMDKAFVKDLCEYLVDLGILVRLGEK